ncbi:unnamed protein product [Albugo candida]|uniref:EamA domain-containing protein n=1 Tax=Albugo candida TaxID=65357 RepID=A0A024GTU4_9STRA|nr:unnamed protein product [Albugo candida]|eukprot:CCI50230.1 unnamed protein product [Albugo candida]
MELKRLWWESKLAIGLISLIIARCVDRVLYTRVTYEYTAFLWYFTNVILPVAFLVTSWPVVWYKMYFKADITPEMRSFPHYKFAIMALFDMLYNLLSAFPTPHIGGNMANVLNQLVLPFNMGLAFLLLQTGFKRGHIMGAILVLYGGLVDMIPLFNGEAPANMPDPSFGWIFLYILSLIPNAASNVYKEIGLKDVDLDIWYANAWISSYQFLLGLASIWTVRIRAFCDPPVPWSEFASYLAKGNDCFLGHPVDFNGKHYTCDTGVLNTFLIFIIFNIIYNQLMLYIFKEGSSVLFVVSSAVCLPLTDLLYMYPMLTGPSAGQKFTIHDGFALFALVMGVLIYHSEKVGRPAGAQSLQKSPMFSSPTLQKTHLMQKCGHGKVLYHQSPQMRKASTGNRSCIPKEIRSIVNRERKSTPSKYGTIEDQNRTNLL